MEQPEISIIFRDVQDLHKSILLYSVLSFAVLFWVIEVYNLVFGKLAEIYKISDIYLLALWVIYGVFFPLYFYSIKHITEVRKDGIYIRVMPFDLYFKKIPYYMIEECKIQAYEIFTGNYINLLKSSKKSDLVVVIKLISGKKIMISSRKPEELYRAITQIET